MSEKEQETKATEQSEPAQEQTDTTSKYEQAAKEFEEVTPMPKVDMATFVLSLSSSALVHLGEVPDPERGTVATNLPLAKHTIDILAMLEESTKGNITDEEARLFRDILFELRMHYVQKST
ncbi:MAG: DUF1844 domain-containing protein [Desulfovibrionales bacterium]